MKISQSYRSYIWQKMTLVIIYVLSNNIKMPALSIEYLVERLYLFYASVSTKMKDIYMSVFSAQLDWSHHFTIIGHNHVYGYWAYRYCVSFWFYYWIYNSFDSTAFILSMYFPLAGMNKKRQLWSRLTRCTLCAEQDILTFDTHRLASCFHGKYCCNFCYFLFYFVFYVC